MIVTNQEEFKNAIASSESLIEVDNDITLTTLTTIGYTVEIQGNNNSSLIWGGTGITNKTMFTVSAAGNLKVTNITLDGSGLDVTLVKVNSGLFTMGSDSILKNLKSTSANSAVKIDKGTFIMEDGVITEINTCLLYTS